MIATQADLRIASSRHGKGVFANRNFKGGERLIEWKGRLTPKNELPEPYDSVEDAYTQVGPGLYVGPSGEFDDFTNHSCDPNAGLREESGKFVLVTIRDISRGEELTWDYSTMSDDGWEMPCSCGSPNCRGVVRDFRHLPSEVQRRYQKLGIVPKWILDATLFSNSREWFHKGHHK